MSGTPCSDKCAILAWFWVGWKDDESNHESWKTFYRIHDVGLPLSWLVDNNYVTLKMGNDAGKKAIEETWTALCQALDVDENKKYATVNEMFDDSPLEFPEEADEGSWWDARNALLSGLILTFSIPVVAVSRG